MSETELETPPLTSSRAWLTGRNMFIGVAILIVAFLVLGTLNQSNGSQSEFAVGLQTQPFLVLAFLSFAGGLLSFVSPCTLPVLTAYFAFAFQSGRSQIATNTLAFMLGLGTTFSLLGAVGFVIGQVLVQNQRLILLLGGALIVVFGVMSLLGSGFTGFKETGQTRSTTLGGSYLFGLTFAVGWSSCVGPILGSVLTLAAQTTSVWRGMMLLFIYTLGLGLPLLVVSTFFGRMSRKSLFWRILKGKGWDWDTHVFVVALVWAVAAWRVLTAVAAYAYRQFDMFTGQEFTIGHQIGLLALTIAIAALWTFTSPGERKTTVHLHTTQIVSGALFILMGILMLESKLALFNNLLPTDLADWLANTEEKLINLFN
ncbi:MAG: cytochrome c biogenesis protein CcdA [Ardenticatenaceae bacterium]|nr:cytochrome c biogenesis protein CcdA [Ardenticatenaceae bacterium]MCB9005560.1 cytochrome c biogenesis protein CcdA [Ardenticatenaceae bacterium]